MLPPALMLVSAATMKFVISLILAITLFTDNKAHRMANASNGNTFTGKAVDDYNVRLHCCVTESCPCYSLIDLLVNFTSNATVYIRTDLILSSVIQLRDLKNIAIIGYNDPTVQCGYSGGLHFVSCCNITIEGIIWNGFNVNATVDVTQGIVIHLHHSSNIDLQNCTFQNLLCQSIVLSEVTGNVKISKCKFMHNNYQSHGTAIQCTSNDNTPLVFTIDTCTFNYNEGASIVHLYQYGTSQKYLQLQNSIFKNNQGSPTYILNQQLYITGMVLFEENNATSGGGPFATDHAKIIFNNNSIVTFSKNLANNGGGGAVFISNSVVVSFEQNAIIVFNNNTADNGGAVCSRNDSILIITRNSKITFSGNVAILGGAVVCYNSCVLLLVGNCIVTFTDNTAEKGGAICLISNTKMILDNKTVMTFTNNSATHWGGAVHSENNVSIVSKGISSVVFNDNYAKKVGGALSIHDNANYAVKGNSAVVFYNNKAAVGGAAVCNVNCKFTVKEHSLLIFYDNSAEDGGAAVYDDHAVLLVKGNSAMIFTNNKAAMNGGALCLIALH